MEPSFQEIASLEEQRALRSGRWFSLVRLAPVGWGALDLEVDVLEALVRAHLRRTDVVCRLRDREVGVLLIDTRGRKAPPAVARLRAAIGADLEELGIEVRMAWAPVGPEQQMTWHQAWSWAGQLLVADATVPAAA